MARHKKTPRIIAGLKFEETAILFGKGKATRRQLQRAMMLYANERLADPQPGDEELLTEEAEDSHITAADLEDDDSGDE